MLKLFLLLFLVSCASNKPLGPIKHSEPSIPEQTTYYNKAKIVDAFKAYSKNVMGNRAGEKLAKVGVSRKADLADDSTFFPKNKLNDIVNRKRIIQASPLSIKGEADLRSRDSAITQQWDGTCTAFGLTAAIENSLGGKIALSKRHIWNRYRQYSVDAAIKAWDNSSNCITVIGKWPSSNYNPYYGYLDKEFCHSFLIKTTYVADDVQKILTALDNGKPTYIGLSVTNSLLNGDAIINPNSSATGGGHAVSIVGYKLDENVLGGGYFIIKNSWGDKNGDKGYQYLSFNHCQRKDLYCLAWVIEEVKG